MLWVRAGARCLLAAAACAAVSAGCGSSTGHTGTSATTGTTGTTAAKVSLDIRVSGVPGSPARHWTLRCDPAGGTHPAPVATCAALLNAKNAFEPPSKRIMCPMILAGTKVATVKGTYFGRHIDTTITEGGCWLAEWDHLRKLFY